MPRSKKSPSKKELCNNVGGNAPKISLNPNENNCSAYRDLLLVWFADKAIKYITGRNIYDINNSNFKDIFSEIKNFFDEHSNSFHFIKKGDELVPAPPGQRIKNISSRRFIEEALGNALNGTVRECRLAFTGLTVEFSAYTRGFMLKTHVEKRNLKVDETVLALMDIGILLTYVGAIGRIESPYLGEEGGRIECPYLGEEKEGECLYLAIDWEPLVSEFLEPWRRVQVDAKNIVHAVLVKGEGSIRTALVGMAAAVANALGYLRGLSAVRGEFVRIAVAGNKTMLKSVDVFDLLDLASILQQYGLASPLFELTCGHVPPNRQHKETCIYLTDARRFVDMVAEAVLRYQRHRDLGELYRVVRAAARYKNEDQKMNKIVNRIIEGLSR